MSSASFHGCVTAFFTRYLTIERGVSPNTMRSYAKAFSSLIDYLLAAKKIKSHNICLNSIVRVNIIGCLDWLQQEHSMADTSRNQRLAAFKSFARYMQYVDVTRLAQWQEILSIKQKRTSTTIVKHLPISDIKLLLNQIPFSTWDGRRDLVMLTLLYETGARAQEIADLIPSCLRLENPAYVILTGKGNKSRMVPLQPNVVNLLKKYLDSLNVSTDKQREVPLFTNKMGGSLSTCGITYILQKYATIAAAKGASSISPKITPHCLRHSRAMHWLQNDINLVYIRDLLGHVSIKTTEVYARADSQKKREAIERAYSPVVPQNIELGSWEKDSELKSWLKSLGNHYQK